MEETEFFGDIFQCDIVGDNVLFQSGRERFSESRIRVQIMDCVRGCDKEVRTQLPFRSQRTSADGRSGPEAQDVVGELAIQKADPILPGNSEFCAVAKVKEHDRGEFSQILDFETIDSTNFER
jgi:hypothetical protein